MFCMCDSFDAMISDRPCRGRKSFIECFEAGEFAGVIGGAGTIKTP